MCLAGAVDFDSVAEELYAGSRDEFIPRRAKRAAQAKTAGDKELAAKIKALRKPTVAAWLVNQVARDHAGELGDLARLGERMRAAHADLAGDKIRTLSARRREALQSLTDKARAIGRDAGHPVSESVADQVWTILEAALGDTEVAQRIASGRLDATLSTSDADVWLTAGSAPPSGGAWHPPPKAEPAEPKPKTRKQDKAAEAKAEAEAARHRQELERVRQKASEAEDLRRQAEASLAEAQQESRNAAETVSELRDQLTGAERRARAARKAVTEAQRELDSAARRADTAKRDLQRLERS